MERRTFEELISLPSREIARLFESGSVPEPEQLVDWEYRGFNLAPVTKILGIKKFRKGFYRHDGEVWGYNIPVRQSGSAAWRCRPSDDAPKRFGFYRTRVVAPDDSTVKVARSLLLDYGEGKNGLFESSLLRDYVRAIVPGESDLLIGKAYLALLGGELFQSYFVISRDRQAPTPVQHRE